METQLVEANDVRPMLIASLPVRLRVNVAAPWRIVGSLPPLDHVWFHDAASQSGLMYKGIDVDTGLCLLRNAQTPQQGICIDPSLCASRS